MLLVAQIQILYATALKQFSHFIHMQLWEMGLELIDFIIHQIFQQMILLENVKLVVAKVKAMVLMGNVEGSLLIIMIQIQSYHLITVFLN